MLLVAGCRQTDMWEGSEAVETPVEAPSLIALQERETKATSSEEITHIIRDYQWHAARGHEVVLAQTRAAGLYLLLGAKYATTNSSQRMYYRKALMATEAAMLQNPAFRSAVEMGQPVPVAANNLPPDLYEPLFLWATAIFYHFRDVASVPERFLFKNRLSLAAEAIEVMLHKDPDWFGGNLQFSLGIYYLSVPEIVGGDREKATRLINEAIGISQNNLLTRWGRAKYLAVATGNATMFQQDLEWVLQQDLREMDGPVIWNRYFIEDSKALLADKDRLFRK